MTSPPLVWSLVAEATPAEVAVVSHGVFHHGRTLAHDGNAAPVACLVHCGAEVVAGGVGRTEYARLFVTQLWVAEGLRRRGIGTRILSELEAEAARRGCADALIETLGDAAAALYGRLGYRVVARVPRYVGRFTKHVMVKPVLA